MIEIQKRHTSISCFIFQFLNENLCIIFSIDCPCERMNLVSAHQPENHTLLGMELLSIAGYESFDDSVSGASHLLSPGNYNVQAIDNIVDPRTIQV